MAGLVLNQVFGMQGAAEPEIVIVRPVVTDALLSNPGVGFMTFQRFNGDKLNEGSRWTEGFPIEYQEFDGDLSNESHPDTTIAYFRVNWRFVEPEMGVYNWEMIDKALRTAASRGQSVILRISPYEGVAEKDIPEWYRELVGPEPGLPIDKWRTDPENGLYVKHFGGMIRELGKRYDGHPNLEAVDVAIVGFWGEGEGSHLLSDATRIALLRCYVDSFKKSFLIFQPLNGDAPDPGILVRGLPIAAYWQDGTNNGEGSDMRHLGWRIDCLGDMGFWRETRGSWSHMFDVYPQDILKSGMKDAWKKAPITMEICGTFLRWKETEGYDAEAVKYVFDQALKWHVSSFNAKSSPVPAEWESLVNDWLKKMGYRLALRKFTYPSIVAEQGQIAFTSWWENQGVAPCYRNYPLALRLRSDRGAKVLLTDADIRQWLPGDSLYDDAVYLPAEVTAGTYQLEIGIVDRQNHEPVVQLAIEGRRPDGWYPLGTIQITAPK